MMPLFSEFPLEEQQVGDEYRTIGIHKVQEFSTFEMLYLKQVKYFWL